MVVEKNTKHETFFMTLRTHETTPNDNYKGCFGGFTSPVSDILHRLLATQPAALWS